MLRHFYPLKRPVGCSSLRNNKVPKRLCNDIILPEVLAKTAHIRAKSDGQSTLDLWVFGRNTTDSVFSALSWLAIQTIILSFLFFKCPESISYSILWIVKYFNTVETKVAYWKFINLP